MPMPYIITTRHPTEPHDGSPRARRSAQQAATYRHAVATPEEARTTAARFVHDCIGTETNLGYETRPLITPAFIAEARELPESGGTVGPLPDGTVIEVAELSLVDLWRGAGWDYIAARDAGALASVQQACDAYNARSQSDRPETAEPHDPIPDRGPPDLAADAYEAWRQR